MDLHKLRKSKSVRVRAPLTLHKGCLIASNNNISDFVIELCSLQVV